MNNKIVKIFSPNQYGDSEDIFFLLILYLQQYTYTGIYFKTSQRHNNVIHLLSFLGVKDDIKQTPPKLFDSVYQALALYFIIFFAYEN